MQLVFDAFELTPHSTKSKGIYSYALNLCRALAMQLRQGEHMHVVAHGENIEDFRTLQAFPNVTVHELAPQMPSKWRRLWWREWGAARWCRAHAGVQAVYLSPKGFTPGAGRRWFELPVVCVVHDLIPLWYLAHAPAHFGRIEGALVKAGLLHSAHHADRLIAISEATAEALISVGAPADRISVVYNGVPPLPNAEVEDVRWAMSQGRFVLAMASGLPHKNLRGILAAYQAYRQLAGVQALPLKLVGVSQEQVDAVSAEADLAGVMALGNVSASQLAALYRYAEVSLFLSWIEGFGFPPLEALRAGTPVVCSDIAAHRELCSGMANLVSPSDPVAAAAALWASQEANTHVSASMAEEARSLRIQQMQALLADRLNWQSCAGGVWQSIRSLSAPSKGRI